MGPRHIPAQDCRLSPNTIELTWFHYYYFLLQKFSVYLSLKLLTKALGWDQEENKWPTLRGIRGIATRRLRFIYFTPPRYKNTLAHAPLLQTTVACASRNYANFFPSSQWVRANTGGKRNTSTLTSRCHEYKTLKTKGEQFLFKFLYRKIYANAKKLSKINK